jgi:hypothetical protein
MSEVQALVRRLESWEQSLAVRETTLAAAIEARVSDESTQALVSDGVRRGQLLERQRTLELINWLQRDFIRSNHTYNTLENLKKHVAFPTDRTPDHLR